MYTMNDQFATASRQFADNAAQANRLLLQNAENAFALQLATFEQNANAAFAFIGEMVEARDFDALKTVWPKGLQVARESAERNVGAAQEVFVAQGYHAAAMDDIAERAGVSKPVLYQHFPGKLDLYLALLDQHCESLIQAVRSALASTTDNKQRVRATMDAYFAYVEDDGGAFRLVFESDLTNEPAVRERR